MAAIKFRGGEAQTNFPLEGYGAEVAARDKARPLNRAGARLLPDGPRQQRVVNSSVLHPRTRAGPAAQSWHPYVPKHAPLQGP